MVITFDLAIALTLARERGARALRFCCTCSSLNRMEMPVVGEEETRPEVSNGDDIAAEETER